MALLPGWKGLRSPSRNKLSALDLSLPADVIQTDCVSKVHSWVLGRISYASDRDDEWQSPKETLKRGRGDCEDFCILEFAILKKMGIPSELVLVKDLVTKENHAILVVGGVFLDNRHDEPIDIMQFKDYFPSYGYTEDNVYLYGRLKEQ